MKTPSQRARVFYFAVDTKELLKGDMLKRFQAYRLAGEARSRDHEVRYREHLPSDQLGLQDVLYYPKANKKGSRLVFSLLPFFSELHFQYYSPRIHYKVHEGLS